MFVSAVTKKEGRSLRSPALKFGVTAMRLFLGGRRRHGNPHPNPPVQLVEIGQRPEAGLNAPGGCRWQVDWMFRRTSIAARRFTGRRGPYGRRRIGRQDDGMRGRSWRGPDGRRIAGFGGRNHDGMGGGAAGPDPRRRASDGVLGMAETGPDSRRVVDRVSRVAGTRPDLRRWAGDGVGWDAGGHSRERHKPKQLWLLREHYSELLRGYLTTQTVAIPQHSTGRAVPNCDLPI